MGNALELFDTATLSPSRPKKTPVPALDPAAAATFGSVIQFLFGDGPRRCVVSHGWICVSGEGADLYRKCNSAADPFLLTGDPGALRAALGTSKPRPSLWSNPEVRMPDPRPRHPVADFVRFASALPDLKTATFTDNGDCIAVGSNAAVSWLADKPTATRAVCVDLAPIVSAQLLLGAFTWFSVESSDSLWLGNDHWMFRFDSCGEPANPRSVQRVILGSYCCYRVEAFDLSPVPPGGDGPVQIICDPRSGVTCHVWGQSFALPGQSHCPQFGIIRLPHARILDFLSDGVDFYLPSRPAMPFGIRVGRLWILAGAGW